MQQVWIFFRSKKVLFRGIVLDEISWEEQNQTGIFQTSPFGRRKDSWLILVPFGSQGDLPRLKGNGSWKQECGFAFATAGAALSLQYCRWEGRNPEAAQGSPSYSSPLRKGVEQQLLYVLVVIRETHEGSGQWRNSACPSAPNTTLCWRCYGRQPSPEMGGISCQALLKRNSAGVDSESVVRHCESPQLVLH